MNLINEALSRVRTRTPQNTNSEAHRSARRIAIQARHQQARELGNLAHVRHPLTRASLPLDRYHGNAPAPPRGGRPPFPARSPRPPPPARRRHPASIMESGAEMEPARRVVANRRLTLSTDLESAVVPDEPRPSPPWIRPTWAGCSTGTAELLRYCARRVGPDHAEDVESETFLTAHANFRSYHPNRSGPLPWLYGIATNLLRRHGREEVQALRTFARAGRVAQRASEDWDRAAERVDAFRARHRLAMALASLSRKQRDVLLLFAVAQLAYEEIAVALAMPVARSGPRCTERGRRSAQR